MRWRSTTMGRLTLSDITAPSSVQVWSDRDTARLDQWRQVWDRLAIPSDDLLDRMCPVQDANQQCQLLVLPECANDNEVKALLLAIRQADLTLAEPNVVLVPPAVLGEVNRRFRLLQKPNKRVSIHQIPKHVLFSLLDDLVMWALDVDASDLHLTLHNDKAAADIAFTVNGVLIRPSQFQSVRTHMLSELLSVAWMSVRGGNGALFDPGREQQGRLDRPIRGGTVGLRWASLVTANGPTVCLRVLNPEGRAQAPALDALGYPPEQLAMFERATSGDGGAVILAGMVGSGKSTTLAALVRSIPLSRKVITLEDPVEYVIDNALQCLVTSLETSESDQGLASKLKTIKRSAAHDVLIGEIRGREGGQALVDLVLSGTSVYTTLHASSVMQILLRLTSSLVGVPPSLVSMPGVIKLLVYQALLPKLCAHCALTFDQWGCRSSLFCALDRQRSLRWVEQWWRRLTEAIGIDPSRARFRHPEGCTHCQSRNIQTLVGYAGRLMVAEMLEPAAEPLFFDGIAKRGMAEQLALWESQLRRDGVCDLTQYRSVRARAIDCLNAGCLDPRDFERRFGLIR